GWRRVPPPGRLNEFPILRGQPARGDPVEELGYVVDLAARLLSRLPQPFVGVAHDALSLGIVPVGGNHTSPTHRPATAPLSVLATTTQTTCSVRSARWTSTSALRSITSRPKSSAALGTFTVRRPPSRTSTVPPAAARRPRSDVVLSIPGTSPEPLRNLLCFAFGTNPLSPLTIHPVYGTSGTSAWALRMCPSRARAYVNRSRTGSGGSVKPQL